MKIDNGRLTAYAYSLQQPRNLTNGGDASGSSRSSTTATAGAPTIGPSIGTSGFASSLWTLGATEDSSAGPSPRDELLEWADMDPAERLRAMILEAMGLSEDDLEAMTPEERAAAEDEIRQAMEEKLGVAEQAAEAADKIASAEL